MTKQIHITPRECKIITALCTGYYSNQSIARYLKLTCGSVRIYLSALYRKLGIHSKPQLVVMFKDKLEDLRDLKDLKGLNHEFEIDSVSLSVRTIPSNKSTE